MGVNLFLEKEPDPANVVKSLQIAQAGGFKWIRQDFAWNDIEISAKGNFTDTRNPGNPVGRLGQVRLHSGPGGRNTA